MPAEFQHADAGTDDAGTDVRDLGSSSGHPLTEHISMTPQQSAPYADTQGR